MTSETQGDLAGKVAANLPYLRRYARALTGSQAAGDAYAAAALEAILADPALMEGAAPRTALFRAFHAVWSSAGAPVTEAPDDLISARAQDRMAGLTPQSREALLLHSVEGLGFDEIGLILQTGGDEAARLVEIAMAEMETGLPGKVLVIEDEPIIAMDLTAIVEGMGHKVTGNARTRTEALRLAGEERPDLILADIQLADNSSGIDAVNDILAEASDLPVVFITAFPERLLTGERPEPAFLIPKPYAEDQVWSAVSQAMFFSSTLPLTA